MSFNHGEVFDSLISDFKLEGCSDCLQVEEGGSEMVLDGPHSLGNGFADGLLRFSNLKKYLVIFTVSDFEIDKLDVVNVGGERAQKIISGLEQVLDIFLC